MAERKNRQNDGNVNENVYQENGGFQNGELPYGQNPYGRQGGYQQGPYSQGQNPYGQQGGYQTGPYGQDPRMRGAASHGQQNRSQGGPMNGQRRRPQQGAPNPRGPQGYPSYPSQGQPRRKKKKARRRIFFVLEVLVLVILAGGLFVFSRLNKMQGVNIKSGDIIVNEQIPEKEKEVMQTYTNIALYGVDSREGQLDRDAHSDALMVASINNTTKEIKLVSVYRDTYLDNTNGEYRKATECYFYGGPERSINMLNKNLDLDIQDYVTVDFNVLADVVNAIGGVEIDVDQEEIQWINGYQEEGSQVTGLDIVPVTSPGLQTLNGLQTLSYCRIRYTTGDDYKRTERQREVLEKILGKVKQTPVTNLIGLANEMFDHISTSLTLTEIISLAKDVAAYNLVETTGFPFDKTPMNLPTGGDCVVPVNLANNVLQLHQWLFGSDGYSPSSTVQEISNRIINETGAQ